MDAAQILLCKALGTEKTDQSVLNWQEKGGVPFRAVNDGHIQLMHDGNNHWLLSFCSNREVKVCDSIQSSLRCSLSRITKKCMRSLYRLFVDETGKLVVSIVHVQKRNDGTNCGLFAIAFAAVILDGKSPRSHISMSVRWDIIWYIVWKTKHWFHSLRLINGHVQILVKSLNGFFEYYRPHWLVVVLIVYVSKHFISSRYGFIKMDLLKCFKCHLYPAYQPRVGTDFRQSNFQTVP